jgi:hypothetical protein
LSGHLTLGTIDVKKAHSGRRYAGGAIAFTRAGPATIALEIIGP